MLKYDNNKYYNRVPGWGRKRRFQQSASTHSGAKEKETHNINVVGKTPTNVHKPPKTNSKPPRNDTRTQNKLNNTHTDNTQQIHSYATINNAQQTNSTIILGRLTKKF